MNAFRVMWCCAILFVVVSAVDAKSEKKEKKASGSSSVELLVHFREYLPAEDAKAVIEHALHFCHDCRYHVHPKVHALRGTFTDFGVVGTSTPGAVRRALSRQALVREVSENRRILPRHIEEAADHKTTMRALLQPASIDPAQRLHITKLWEKARGTNVRVGIFDTGIVMRHAHFAHNNIASCINFTDNPSCEDGHSHGTFVAGIIASSSECVGITPEAKLHIFKVFTDSQASFTSWFLDAFNHALQSDLDVINFSIGGPDYMDRPFMDKVNEVTAAGITVVSAIGNDGPMYGTLTNPADQMDVIGVGAITSNHGLATFSSRGMTLHELPYGYGRVKPDVVTYGELLRGTNAFGGCKLLSGTSVASPVVAGAVALLASAGKSLGIRINPGMLKQVVTEGAKLLPGELSMYEQGSGMLDVEAAMTRVETFTPHLSSLPSEIDLTRFPYQWPHSAQPIYWTGQPTVLNLTLLSSIDVTTYFTSVTFHTDIPVDQHVLSVALEHAASLWPWSGYLAVKISVNSATFRGLLRGYIAVEAAAPDGRPFSLRIPVLVKIGPTPPREKRLLWDTFHQLHYPAMYVPRDDLDLTTDLLDVVGDHPHTNYRDVFTFLVGTAGYSVELLSTDLTTFNASLYGALLLVDTEEEYFTQEVEKIETDVKDLGLGIVVIADWYNREIMSSLKFIDDHTQDPYSPVTGGANVPGLNDLLRPFGIAMGEKVWRGDVTFTAQHSRTWRVNKFTSGTSVVAFPAGGTLYRTHGALLDMESFKVRNANNWVGQIPILGLAPRGLGRVAVYGDSGCWDAWRNDNLCFELIEGIVAYAATGAMGVGMLKDTAGDLLSADFTAPSDKAPPRPDPDPLRTFSPVARASRDLSAGVVLERVGYPSPTLPRGFLDRKQLPTTTPRPTQLLRTAAPFVVVVATVTAPPPVATEERVVPSTSQMPTLPMLGGVVVALAWYLRRRSGARRKPRGHPLHAA